MDLKITKLENASITGPIRLVLSDGTVGLYEAETVPASRKEPPLVGYETNLTPVDMEDASSVQLQKLVIPQPLPTTPFWDLTALSEGNGEIAYTIFGGGINSLNVDKVTSGTLDAGYTYDVEEIDDPHFVQNTSTSPAKQNYVSAIFSGYQLGLIGLQEQDSQQVPHVSGIVGSSDKPISTGRIFGDLSTGLPAEVSVVYLTNKNVGPLAPNGACCGSPYIATFDTTNNTLGSPTSLLSDIELSDMDLAVAGDYFCLFAITGDGTPLLAIYSQDGKLLGSPNILAGSWNNVGGWTAGPTVIATPGDEIGFSFAFVEMNGDTPVCINVGTLSAPKIEA